MKKQTSIFFALSLLLMSICLIQSCSKAPAIVACLASAPGTASVGATLTFQSCTPNATGFTWNFGDGTSGSGDSLTHVYTAAGTYHGTLTVTSGSASNTAGFTIVIVPNSWAFRTVTYLIDSAVASQPASTLTATGASGSNSAQLVFKFFPYPKVSGSYTVINAENGYTAFLTPNEMFVLLNTDSSGVATHYGSTGSGPVVASVEVGNGKISVTLPITEMVNLNNQSDSTALSASVAQQ